MAVGRIGRYFNSWGWKLKGVMELAGLANGSRSSIWGRGDDAAIVNVRLGALSQTLMLIIPPDGN